MTNSNVGRYSFAAYTYVYSHHICLLQFIYLLRKNKTKKKKNNKKIPEGKCEGYMGIHGTNESTLKVFKNSFCLKFFNLLSMTAKNCTKKRADGTCGVVVLLI